MLLTLFLPLLVPHNFFDNSGSLVCPVVVLPPLPWTLPHHSFIKKMSYRFVYLPSKGGIFSMEVPLPR